VTAEQVLAVARRLLRPQVEVVALVAPEGSAPRELVERAKLH
jgi:hypothetical protein